MIKHGDSLHYLAEDGKIHQAQAGSNERNNKLAIIVGAHELHDVSVFNVFRTPQMAQKAKEARFKGTENDRDAR